MLDVTSERATPFSPIYVERHPVTYISPTPHAELIASETNLNWDTMGFSNVPCKATTESIYDPATKKWGAIQVKPNQMVVSVPTHNLYFLGSFEGMKATPIFKDSELVGARLFRPDFHLARLNKGLKSQGMPELTKEAFEATVFRSISENRDSLPPEKYKDAALYIRVDVEPVPDDGKFKANYGPWFGVSGDIKALGYTDALFTYEEKGKRFVAEATSSNMLVLMGEKGKPETYVVIRPKAPGNLNGTSSSSALHLLKENGVPAYESKLPLDVLLGKQSPLEVYSDVGKVRRASEKTQVLAIHMAGTAAGLRTDITGIDFQGIGEEDVFEVKREKLDFDENPLAQVAEQLEQIKNGELPDENGWNKEIFFADYPQLVPDVPVPQTSLLDTVYSYLKTWI
ncbi:hypothetical protein DID80_05045 [Candidatus Marinamargulisbacteria bacterium SCGC AAA071-K20]|nr:hypothetical protein DID80_05045 [Candidatus Marinamargulisbacteria bacterium SCGC AAA071-K20]